MLLFFSYAAFWALSSSIAQYKLSEEQVKAEVDKIRVVEKKDTLLDDPEADDPILADVESHKRSLFSVDKKVGALDRQSAALALEGSTSDRKLQCFPSTVHT